MPHQFGYLPLEFPPIRKIFPPTRTSPASMTDPATVALLAAQDGDPAAFETFVRITRSDVTGYCRYLGDPDHVDDLVQDTYLRALRSLGTF